MNDTQALKLIAARFPGMAKALENAQEATSVFIGRQANDPVLPIIQAVREALDDLRYCQEIAGGKGQPEQPDGGFAEFHRKFTEMYDALEAKQAQPDTTGIMPDSRKLHYLAGLLPGVENNLRRMAQFCTADANQAMGDTLDTILRAKEILSMPNGDAVSTQSDADALETKLGLIHKAAEIAFSDGITPEGMFEQLRFILNESEAE